MADFVPRQLTPEEAATKKLMEIGGLYNVTYAAVKELLDAGANPKVTISANRDSLLHIAIRRQWGKQAIDELVNIYHVDLEAKDYKDVTPVMEAAKSSLTINMVEYLVEELGANVHNVSVDGDNLLTLVAGVGNLRLINVLLDKDVSMTPSIPRSSLYPGTRQLNRKFALVTATERKAHPRVLVRLIEASIAANHQTLSEVINFQTKPDDNTALTKSIIQSSEPHIQLLLDAGANPYLRARGGTDAFHPTRGWNGNRPMPKALQRFQQHPVLVLQPDPAYPWQQHIVLKEKSDLFAHNKHQMTLLDNPETWHRWEDVAAAIHANGEKITVEDLMGVNLDGKPWLHRAIECFSAPQVLKYLQQNDQLPTKKMLLAPSRDGSSLFDSAVSWSYMDILLAAAEEAGTPFTKQDFLKQDKQGISLLQRSVAGGKIVEVLRYLNGIGNPIVTEDLQTMGKFFDSLAAFKDVSRVFTFEVWQGRSPRELTAWYNAMPEAGKTQVTNYQTLLAKLSRSKPLQKPQSPDTHQSFVQLADARMAAQHFGRS